MTHELLGKFLEYCNQQKSQDIYFQKWNITFTVWEQGIKTTVGAIPHVATWPLTVARVITILWGCRLDLNYGI
jgi:hypothetical protein